MFSVNNAKAEQLGMKCWYSHLHTKRHIYTESTVISRTNV